MPSLSPEPGRCEESNGFTSHQQRLRMAAESQAGSAHWGVPCLLLVKAEPGGPGTPKSRLPFQTLETSSHFAREQGVYTGTACKTRPMGAVEGVRRGRTTCAGSRLGVSGRGTAAEPEAHRLPAAPPAWPRDVYTRFDAICVKSLLKQNAVLSRRHQNMTGGWEVCDNPDPHTASAPPSTTPA